MSSSSLGEAGRGGGAGGTHISSADVARHSRSPPNVCGGDSSLCHQRGALGRGSPAYGVSNFLVTSGALARRRDGAAEESVPNRSPLPAPSGRILLLYADELITVASIWLLYIKKRKNAGSSHCVNSHPRAYHFTAQVFYYLKTSF